MADPDDSDLDAIADALARLRPRRRPGGPHAGRAHGFGHPHHRADDTDGPPGPRGGLARLRLLEALAAASHPLSVSEIGSTIGVDQPRASRLVQQAVELELVRREADPDDARRTRIALTAAGETFASGVRGERRAALAAALAGFTDSERTELTRLLAKLAAAWPRG